MKTRVKDLFLTFLIAFPLVFIMVFFGYLPIRYDVVLQTDKIVGEGICQSYMCSSGTYAGHYRVTFYFGSQLKKATIVGYHYDVDYIELVNSDVSEFEITGIDTYIKGIHLAHFDPTDILPEGEEVTGTKAKLSSRNGILHVDVFDPDLGSTIGIGQKFIPTWFWIAYFAGIFVLSLLFTFLLNCIFKRFPSLKFASMCLTCIGVSYLAGCYFCGSFPFVTYTKLLLNILFLYSLSLLINAVSLPYLGTLLTMGFTIIWYIANYYVITLRNKPIMPADLKAAGTAAEVMGGYTFVPSWKMVLGLLIVLIYAFILIFIWKQNKSIEKQPLKTRMIKRGISAIAAIILFFFGINTKTFKSLNDFAWDAVLLKSFHEDGMVLTYLKSVYNSDVKKPDGYTKEIVDDYLKEYQAITIEDEDGIQPVNIIMIMNEAFSDLRDVGLSEQIDVMPFIDNLKENTIEGNCYVSIFGGGTCNTEFEALTGNSLAFFGSGAYPYTDSVTDQLFSLAEYFRNIGYSTTSFHANNPHNWNRNMVYPNLGFETFYSINDYEEHGEVEYLHDLPADISDYLFIESVNQQKKGQKQFLFNVTMQNHSGYERWLDVEKPETVEEHGNQLYEDTQIYLSLIKASDDEVKQLVEHYQNIEEPTMIIFFGDHQPGLPGVAINEIYTGVESYLDFYKTEFFIWTNYESEEIRDYKISANYLPWLILERGNFPLPPFIQMLKEVYSRYPIISSQGVMNSEGDVYAGVSEVLEDSLIKKYQYIQYANLYDDIDPSWFKIK